MLCSLLILSGYFFPKVSLAVGVTNCVMRPVYNVMYSSQGSSGRKLGQILGTGTMCFVLIPTIVYGLVKA